VAAGLRNYYDTPEGVAQKRVAAEVLAANVKGLPPPPTGDEWAVVPPSVTELYDISEFIDGFDQADSW